MEMLLPSAKECIVFLYSFESLELPNLLSVQLKSFYLTLVKTNSNLACPLGGLSGLRSKSRDFAEFRCNIIAKIPF